ncbi:1-phosphatidylinositol 4,5-bisphosphate phosphodiesterase eta-2-like, partial [Stegodyphus dumicola]|uniref:1-phosphatidylinositol 4,5-bisphosphate phosphodiesterase eta-2-like n=1 Tax=Stegodyphus dumicola TaxID=202533 RepID=UPI0015ACCA2A
WLIDRIREADVNGNGSLNFEECLGLLKQLNIGMRRSEARKLFDRVKIDGQDALGPEEFIHLYRILNHRPELEEIMKKYSASRSVLWDAEELRTFLYEEQRDSLSIEDCKDMIDEYEPEENKNSGFLSLEGFQKLLTMGQEDIFNKRHRTVYQDMTQPLTHYYIATSHNTYLIQDQLLGESSIEGYVQALKRGCRCLELDTWDGPDEEPIIFHGYTLTSRILLKDVLEAIKKYAFSVSQYPIILSIENHCSVPYQEKMAHYFRTILGEYLYTDCIGEDEKEHPSPESLSKKIFIKGKKLKDELMMSEECHFMLEEEEEREKDLANALASAPTPPGEGDEIIPTVMAASSQRKRIAKELSDLVNYFSAKRFSTFEEIKNSWEFNEMTSLSETVALNLGCTQGTDFVEFNKKHFSRIYPKGTRTDSSNFDPCPFWNLGCQMVALNYQTWDKFVYLNEAKFAQNGRCGYLLKPEYLTSDKISYDPNKPPYPKRQINVTIKVVSAQYLPKPPCASESDVVDPYVSIKVVGHPADQTKKKTSFINNNGYRHIFLEDCRGQKLEKATLFVHVQMSESEQE